MGALLLKGKNESLLTYWLKQKVKAMTLLIAVL